MPSGSLPLTLCPQEGLAFSPTQGSVVTRKISISHDMDVESMVVHVMDQEHSLGEGRRTRALTATVRDEFTSVADGRPLAMNRSLLTLLKEKGGDGDGFDGDSSDTSELDGHAVDYRWDVDDEAWEISFAEDDEGREDWLDDLTFDLDGAMLLPADEVARGDSWDVDLEVMQSLLNPGGRMWLSPPKDSGEDEQGRLAIKVPSMLDVLELGDVEGDATATFVGTEERDGTKLGIITFKFELDCELNASEALARNSEQAGNDTEYDDSLLVREIAGKGRLLWNLDAGVMHSLKIEAEVTVDGHSSQVLETAGQEFEIKTEQEYSGSLEIEIECELEE